MSSTSTKPYRETLPANRKLALHMLEQLHELKLIPRSTYDAAEWGPISVLYTDPGYLDDKITREREVTFTFEPARKDTSRGTKVTLRLVGEHGAYKDDKNRRDLATRVISDDEDIYNMHDPKRLYINWWVKRIQIVWANYTVTFEDTSSSFRGNVGPLINHFAER